MMMRTTMMVHGGVSNLTIERYSDMVIAIEKEEEKELN